MEKLEKYITDDRFVGYIEIPEVPRVLRENYIADTRQGVAVEYIPSKSA